MPYSDENYQLKQGDQHLMMCYVNELILLQGYSRDRHTDDSRTVTMSMMNLR